MVTITGTRTALPRIQTGLWSFDRAFMGINTAVGYPMNTTHEVYGPTHCGKSTIVYSIAGILAKVLGTNIGLADFEGFDTGFLESVFNSVQFDGELSIIGEETDEKRLDVLASGLLNKHKIGILDSVGAISSVSEIEGDLGDANMGRRAKLIAQFSRKVTHSLYDNQGAAVFVINHVHPNLGYAGTSTPGGKTLEYLSGIRSKLKLQERFDDGSYWTVGEVVKNKYGSLGKKYNLVVLAGYGISLDMTAYIDALAVELFTAKHGVVRNPQGEKVCRTSEVLAAARNLNHDLFIPFKEALQNVNNS